GHSLIRSLLVHLLCLNHLKCLNLLLFPPVLWRDWPRCRLRQQWLKLIRSETVSFSWDPPKTPSRLLKPRRTGDPRTARQFSSLLARAPGTQCFSFQRSHAYRHAAWSPYHLRCFLWLCSPGCGVSRNFHQLRICLINDLWPGISFTLTTLYFTPCSLLFP